MLDGQDWISVHAFDHTQTDPLVATISAHLRAWQADGRLRAGFFLRYWAGGPHVRIRLLTREEDRNLLERDLLVLLQARPASSRGPLDADQYDVLQAQALKLEGRTAALPLQPDGTVLPCPYQPEWDRFGGEALAASTVRVFHCSSAVAGRAVEAGWSAPRRLSVAWQGAVATLRQVAADGPSLRAALAGAARFWERAAGPEGPPLPSAALQVWVRGALEGQVAIHPYAAVISGEIARHLAGLAAPGRPLDPDLAVAVALDLLHLHHNRLGFSSWQEAQMWRTLYAAALTTSQGG